MDKVGSSHGFPSLPAILLAMLLLLTGCERPPSSSSPPPPQAAATGQPMQVTVFAIRATPGASAIDPRLSVVRGQLRKVLPDHGFELIATRGERLDPGQTLACELGEGRVAETTYEGAEAGRVSFLCSIREGQSDVPAYTTHVDAPENQLFFYEHTLRDGSRVLIGVGAR